MTAVTYQRNPGESDPQEKQALRERAASLKAGGASLREIGQELGYSHVTIQEWLREPSVRDQVRSLTAQLGEMLLFKVARNVDKALEVQHAVLDGTETDRLKANTANSLVLSFLQRMADVSLDDE